jgi:hypothetical protein
VNPAPHTHIYLMRDTERPSETVLERNQRREAEIDAAMKQEADRHASAIKNMHRLRALRLAREQKGED